MKSLKTFGGVLALLGAMFATLAHAHDYQAGDLTIIHPQARPNLPNRPTAAYMVIANDGAIADRLLSASSPDFSTVELHTVMKHGEVMKMMPVEGIDVPAGDAAVLEPGGFHLMLFDGRQAYKIGQEFALELVFERAGTVEVTVKVEKIGHGGTGHEGHSGHSH